MEKPITGIIPTENDGEKGIRKEMKVQKQERETKEKVRKKSRGSRSAAKEDDIKIIGDGLVVKRISLKECIIYMIFLTLFITMVSMGRTYGEYNYYAADSIKKALEGDRTTKYFAEVSNIEDFWTYTIEEFIPNLLVEEFDNGEWIANPQQRYMVAETNLLMGGFRIGQKRVAPEKCKVPAALEKSFDYCYPPYS